MNGGLIPISKRDLTRAGLEALPPAVARAGEAAAWRFIEFFTATIRNRNTRAAYGQAVGQFFAWCEAHRVRTLEEIRPVVIAAYIENHPGASPTVKQHLAAIRMLFDFLVTGQVAPMNPAASVRGPKHVVRRGKTQVLKADQARALLDSIKTDSIVGLRDRAIIGLMCYTFARVSAMVRMEVADYYQNGKRWWVRLHEKGGKRHEVPCHHNDPRRPKRVAARGGGESGRQGSPLHHAQYICPRHGIRGDLSMRIHAPEKGRLSVAADAGCFKVGIQVSFCIAYLEAGGTIENAQAIAAHESPRTTKLYDRTGDEITLDEVERIAI